MLETGIFAQLQADAGVGALAGDRIYPILMPQESTLPAITYQRISTRDSYAHDGVQCLSKVRMQFDCYAETLLAAEAVAAAVRASLDGQRATWGAVSILASFRVNEQSFYDPTVEAYRMSDDYMITFLDT